LILPIVCKWYHTDDKDPNVQDAVQGIEFRLIERLRKGLRKIEDPSAYIATVARNFLHGALEEASAKKRGGRIEKDVKTGAEKREPIHLDSLEAREEKAREIGQPLPSEGERVFGENEAGPEDLVERRESRGANVITESYMSLPEDLRAGLEKSLDLIADLFQIRDNIRRDRTRGKRILKAIETILKARKIVSRTRDSVSSDRDLQRLFVIREFTNLPAFDGTPETDRRIDALLAEERELEKKYGIVYSLWEAQRKLESELWMIPGLNELIPDELIPGPAPWSGHFTEIAKMNVSPLSVIYKVWSRAPGFSTGASGKYRSRKKIGLALSYHKLVSERTPREFLFSSLKDITKLKDPETAFERFRKAGYGQPLQKKYRLIIDLIYRESFGKKTTP
jgi:hypothetical protein